MSAPIVRYVAGFMFTPNYDAVVLIHKLRPPWAAGLLNAIGGKIENLESPQNAMVREFREETGLTTFEPDWTRFCILRGCVDRTAFEVHFFATRSENTHLTKTVTDEEVFLLRPEDVTVENAMPNLQWLLPMARYIVHDRSSEFVVTEQYHYLPKGAWKG